MRQLEVPYGPDTSERPTRTLFVDCGADVQAGPGSIQVDGDSPDKVVTEDGVIRASYEEPIGRGTHEVTVRPARMSLGGEAVDFLEAPGEPFTGWTLRVLEPAKGNVPEPNEREAAPTRELEVFVDGRPTPDGAVGLEGEVITAKGPGEYELNIVPLGGPALSPMPDVFSENLRAVSREGETLFYAQGFSPAAFQWSVYVEGHIGLLPLGRIAQPVQRAPRRIEDDPLFDLSFGERVSPEGHPNTYRKVTLERRPESGDRWLSGHTVVSPETLLDPTWTPETDPHLTRGDYINERPRPEWGAVALALPLNARLEILGGRDQVCWQGLTRVAPKPVSLQEARSEGLSGGDMELSERLWRAGQIAARKWPKELPARPTPTMRRFTLCRAKMGAGRESGFQGKVSTTNGDVRVTGQSERRLRTRLQRLSRLLERGEPEAPLFPEDEAETRSAALSGPAEGSSGDFRHVRRELGSGNSIVTGSKWRRRHSR
jgi:hypothetical protein